MSPFNVITPSITSYSVTYTVTWTGSTVNTPAACKKCTVENAYVHRKFPLHYVVRKYNQRNESKG